MKRFLQYVCIACAFLQLGACADSLVDTRYRLKLPELPAAWEGFPGQPHWRIEWQDTEARLRTLEIRSGYEPEISLPCTWASAVTAWPYWPELQVHPGVFRPAGALFPFDANGDTLTLSWRGGVDAILHRELGAASAKIPAEHTGVPRLPWNFNWPRFRALYDDASVNAEFRGDPWRADWPGIAAKIWQSGFDKRRLVPQAYKEIKVQAAPGPWIGTSPFSAPLFFESTPVFPVRAADPDSGSGSSPADTWISTEGILRCNAETYIFLKWEQIASPRPLGHCRQSKIN